MGRRGENKQRERRKDNIALAQSVFTSVARLQRSQRVDALCVQPSNASAVEPERKREGAEVNPRLFLLSFSAKHPHFPPHPPPPHAVCRGAGAVRDSARALGKADGAAGEAGARGRQRAAGEERRSIVRHDEQQRELFCGGRLRRSKRTTRHTQRRCRSDGAQSPHRPMIVPHHVSSFCPAVQPRSLSVWTPL